MATPSCHTCQKKIYAAENPQQVANMFFHAACLKCKTCATKLIIKTANTAEGEVYCKNHVPHEAPNQVIDVTIAGQMAAPDCAHSSLQFQKSEPSAHIGVDSFAIQGALNAPKPASSIGNIDRTEQLHQSGAKFTS